MIRYRVTRKQLEASIEKEAPGWLARAKQNPRKGIWNQVRRVYTDLQRGKCAYCERLLSDPDLVVAGHGRPVDHFRPKSKYPHLAHEIFNLAVACTDCNSALKKNKFPLDKRKRPLLIYPIGPVDSNPESLIQFDGYFARPAKSKGYAHERARSTLKFFGSGPDGLTRRELLRERAMQICLIWRDRRRNLTAYLSPEQPHANCCRCFVKLCESNLAEAEQMFKIADDYLRSLGYRRPTKRDVI